VFISLRKIYNKHKNKQKLIKHPRTKRHKGKKKKKKITNKRGTQKKKIPDTNNIKEKILEGKKKGWGLGEKKTNITKRDIKQSN